MNISDILIRPIITEKTTTQLNGPSTYAFEVGIQANKIQIKQAVEAFFGVEVADVRTAIVRGKSKRRGRHLGKRNNWKKAYVRLADGLTLPIYEA